jgi:spore germination protein KC
VRKLPILLILLAVFTTLTSTGKTISDAFMNIQKRLNQALFLGHTRVIVISEDVAKKGVQGVMDGFRRDPQLRRLLWPIVVRGKASEFLELSPEIEQIPTVFVMSLIESGVKSGFIPTITLGDFFIALSNKAMQPTINHLTMGNKNDIRWEGIGVFRKDRLVGFLNEKETWALIQITENSPGGDVLIKVDDAKDDEAYASFQPKVVDTKMKVNHTDDHRVTVDIHVEVEGNIIETTYSIDFTKEGNIKRLEADIEKDLTKRAEKLIDKLQNKLKSDILFIGLKVKGYHYRDLWQRIDWEKEFPNAEIQVTYDVKIRRIDMEMK